MCIVEGNQQIRQVGKVKIGLTGSENRPCLNFCQASKHLSAQADSQIIIYMTFKYYFYCHKCSSFVNSKKKKKKRRQARHDIINEFGYPTQCE